jgi:hypothetical protein
VKGATAIARHGEVLLVAADRRVLTYRSRSGERLSPSFSADLHVSAIARGDGWLALGYEEGSIEIVSLAPGSRPRSRVSTSLEAVPSSAVLRLRPGPGRTLIAGFANGLLGLWDLETGQRLEQRRLHGPVLHLLLQDDRLVAATDLGRHTVWDLRILRASYCELLRRVWARVPVIWEKGAPVRRAPSLSHRCLASERY